MNTIVLTAGGAKPTGDVLTAGGATPPTGGASGGSGATVTAINKMGATIFTGQKVWLNENQQTAGSSYEFAETGYTIYYGGVISRSGNFGWRNNKLYSIGADTATFVNDFTAKMDIVKYGEDGSTFIMSNYTTRRIDEKAQYTIDYCYIGDDYFMNSQNKVVRVNITDGSIIEELNTVNSPYNQVFEINGVFYNTAGYKFVYNGSTYEQIKITSNTSTYLCPVGVTIDNKYVICSDTKNFASSSVAKLRIVEMVDEDNIKLLTQSEMPVELQEFYATPCNIVFNPYTGILTVTGYITSSYAVMKYENGTWTPIPVDLGLDDLTTCGVLTLSDDLTRACYGYNNGTQYWIIANLTSTSGYAAVPYRFYNVNENTITGYAGNDTEPDNEVVVGIASVPVVDNGGTGGGNYEPTTPPLEEAVLDENYIDVSKVASVGRVFNTDRNEPTAVDLANLTEDSGFTQYSNSLFGSEDKSLADEFFIRFHFSDRVGNKFMKSQFVYLFGHNTASDGGNWWDEKDRSSQFAIPFGFDSEWIYKIVGVNTGFVDENGWHSPNTRVDIGGELSFGWNTVKMYYNNDIQMWCLAFGDNYTNEYPIPELPKVCEPYNLNTFIENSGEGDNCVDLAETGFKLNGEWVWRAVK